MPSARLSNNGRAYVSAVIFFGFLVVLSSLYELVKTPIGLQWFLLVGLTLISGSATVKLPSVPASISISETFVFAAVLLYGPGAGTITVALDGLVISFWISKRRKEAYRALFNMSAPAVSAWCSATIYFWITGIPPLASAPPSLLAEPGALLGTILPGLFVFAGAYFSLNSWLIAFAISLETRVSAYKVWRENFVWLSLNYFCGASVAVLLVTYSREVDLRFVGVILPLLLLLYFTFKISMERVEDANRHVEKVNRMYLSTIETLAMAIDAKDQVTHGHLRRVQRFAVGLARELGVTDDGMIKAIEAAALLHDMGKLAIPEHILNKPGKLTAAEFEKMKEHASIGAEILSSIDFPYPVVPIVRYHHESWDGSGYPDGLRGADIPIGARILAVVDCFDALTSDRPYRKALTAEEALEIVRSRQGSMYDPWVVQKFEEVHERLERSEDAKPQLSAALGGRPSEPVLAFHKVKDCEILGATEVSGRSFSGIAFKRVDEAVIERIHCLMPDTTVVLFRYDSRVDELVGSLAKGTAAKILFGTRIKVGECLSGWVAATRQPMINAEASLDFDLSAFGFGAPLFTLSTPVLVGEVLSSVLSIYSPSEFTNDDLRLLSAIASDSASAAAADRKPS